jgi:hypothetical protein
MPFVGHCVLVHPADPAHAGGDFFEQRGRLIGTANAALAERSQAGECEEFSASQTHNRMIASAQGV